MLLNYHCIILLCSGPLVGIGASVGICRVLVGISPLVGISGVLVGICRVLVGISPLVGMSGVLVGMDHLVGICGVLVGICKLFGWSSNLRALLG